MKRIKIPIIITDDIQKEIHDYFNNQKLITSKLKFITDEYIFDLILTEKNKVWNKLLVVSFEMYYKNSTIEITPQNDIAISKEEDFYCVLNFLKKDINYLLLIQKDNIKTDSAIEKYNKIYSLYKEQAWIKVLNLIHYTDFNSPDEKAIMGIILCICSLFLRVCPKTKAIKLLQKFDYYGYNLLNITDLMELFQNYDDYDDFANALISLAVFLLHEFDLFKNKDDTYNFIINLLDNVKY